MVEWLKDYAIFMLDPGGHIVSWNRETKRIFGYRADEIIGCHFIAISSGKGETVKRIIFWTMAIILIVVVAMFVFTNKTGGAATLEEAAKKLEEKHIEGNVYAKFQGFALDHGFEYKYILKSDQEELIKARYQPFSGTVTLLDLR